VGTSSATDSKSVWLAKTVCSSSEFTPELVITFARNRLAKKAIGYFGSGSSLVTRFGSVRTFACRFGGSGNVLGLLTFHFASVIVLVRGRCPPHK